jgi:DnaJ-class molecular chaperone
MREKMKPIYINGVLFANFSFNMGAEYSHQGRNAIGRHMIYETYSGKRKGRSGERCYKCGGNGKIYVESECNSCRGEDRTTWSNYTRHCSCNGYGRQTSYEQCDDCHGRGYQ